MYFIDANMSNVQTIELIILLGVWTFLIPLVVAMALHKPHPKKKELKQLCSRVESKLDDLQTQWPLVAPWFLAEEAMRLVMEEEDLPSDLCEDLVECMLHNKNNIEDSMDCTNVSDASSFNSDNDDDDDLSIEDTPTRAPGKIVLLEFPPKFLCSETNNNDKDGNGSFALMSIDGLPSDMDEEDQDENETEWEEQHNTNFEFPKEDKDFNYNRFDLPEEEIDSPPEDVDGDEDSDSYTSYSNNHFDFPEEEIDSPPEDVDGDEDSNKPHFNNHFDFPEEDIDSPPEDVDGDEEPHDGSGGFYGYDYDYEFFESEESEDLTEDELQLREEAMLAAADLMDVSFPLNAKQINKEFRKIAFQYHPDRQPPGCLTREQADERFKFLNNVRDFLVKSAEKRWDWDAFAPQAPQEQQGNEHTKPSIQLLRHQDNSKLLEAPSRKRPQRNNNDEEAEVNVGPPAKRVKLVEPENHDSEDEEATPAEDPSKIDTSNVFGFYPEYRECEHWLSYAEYIQMINRPNGNEEFEAYIRNELTSPLEEMDFLHFLKIAEFCMKYGHGITPAEASEMEEDDLRLYTDMLLTDKLDEFLEEMDAFRNQA